MDTDHTTFTIVFDKVQESTGDLAAMALLAGLEADHEELDEIAELRRLVLEITEPDPVSYTTV